VVVWLKLPDVPRIVTVNVPVLAELLAVSFSVLVRLVVVGVKDAVTPAGKPVAERFTLPLKPFTGVTVTVLPPLDPCVTLTLVGEADSVKSVATAAFTVRVTETELTRLPDVPVIVTVEVPRVAVSFAVSVSTAEVPPPLQAELTPLGKGESDTETEPAKPFTGTRVIVVEAPMFPCEIAIAVGEAVRENFGAFEAFTVRLIVAVCVKPPDTPVIMMDDVPVVAELLAVKVSVLVLVALAGLKDAVTPLGRPEAESPTLPLNPF
jgi:hypothetical protein